jgi:hypothetical protein
MTRIAGLVLIPAFTLAGCTAAMARHDLFEGADVRVDRMVETARLACRAQQPTRIRSATQYERCVLQALQKNDWVD